MQSVASCTLSPHQVTHPLAFVRALPLASVAPTLCSTCRLRTLCLPGSMQAAELKSIDELVYTRRRIHPGEHLFHAGDPFHALYAFRSGFFKSYVITSDGQTQVTGFPMAGDLAGMDGMGSERHAQSVVALDTGEVCILPYARLQEQARRLSRASAADQPHHEPRDRARAANDDLAGHDDGRGQGRGLPAFPVAPFR